MTPVTLKSVIRMAEKKHLGHPKLEGRGQTLTTHTTLENLSDKAKFFDWHRPPMKEKNISKILLYFYEIDIEGKECHVDDSKPMRHLL